jgi:hypothetical protein
MNTTLWLLPEENLGVVVTTNTFNSFMTALAQRVVDRYLGIRTDRTTPGPGVHQRPSPGPRPPGTRSTRPGRTGTVAIAFPSPPSRAASRTRSTARPR